MSADEQLHTVPGVLAAAAGRHPDTEALVDGPVRMTYRELAAEVRRVSAGLLAVGVETGERVAIWGPNSHRWVTSALGALSVGAVLVPVNTRYKGEEAAALLVDSGARTLFVDNGFLGHDYLAMLRDAGGPDPSVSELAALPGLRDIVMLGEQGEHGGQGGSSGAGGAEPVSWSGFLRGGATVEDAAVTARAASVRADDISDMLFTSGTTGRPKGAMTAHGQNIRAFTAWSERSGLRHGDRYLIVNPLFHSFGYKAGVLACLIRGATMVTQPVFEVRETMRLVSEERISVLPGPPALYVSLLDHPDRASYDTGSLRLAVTGAAVVPVAVVERMRDELCPQVLTAYGLTEACGMVSMCTLDDDARTVAETSGRAIDGTELAVQGPNGEQLGPGESGEVVVRGYNVMRGYFGDEAGTAAAVDAAGWLHTGDIGHQDGRGNVTVTDRLKDMFLVGGFNVYPAEVEQLLARHPEVSEAAVVGVPDSRLGEVGRAYVTAVPAAVPAPEEVIGFCRERLANFKVPREVIVVDQLPRNAVGKVVKHRLDRD